MNSYMELTSLASRKEISVGFDKNLRAGLGDA